MSVKIDALKAEVQELIDERTRSFSPGDYREFLSWLGSEAECREMALDDEEFEDDE